MAALVERGGERGSERKAGRGNDVALLAINRQMSQINVIYIKRGQKLQLEACERASELPLLSRLGAGQLRFIYIKFIRYEII